MQILELLFNGRFAIELLVILLLGGAYLVAHLHELEVFIDHLLHHIEAPCLAVLGEQGVALLALAGHPRRQARGHIAHGGPHGGEDAQSRLPGLPFPEGQHRFLDRDQAFLCVDRVQIIQIRTAGDLEMDAALALGLNLLHVYAGVELDGDKALQVGLAHDAGHADGIKAVGFDGIAGDGLLGDDQDNLGILLGFAAAHAAVILRTQIDRRIGHSDGIMYG